MTRWALAHKRIVLIGWLVLTVAGMAFSAKAVKALSDQYSVPGSEGSTTNAAIARVYGSGGATAPLVPVVTLPPGTGVDAPAVQSGLREIDSRIARAVPGVRVASYVTTGDRAFVSRDGRTTFVLAYPPPVRGEFGQNREAMAATKVALSGLTVAGAPVHLTGIDVLSAESGTTGGTGLLGEALIGGLGALCVLAFVFGSFLALLPLVVAIVSITTSFLFVWGLASATPISVIVSFLIGLLGLGVAIDYSLIIVARWREERSAGHEGDDAVVRAMCTAGRAVLFSGTTVAIGLLALIALPVPYLRSVGYGGMVIPLISVVTAVTLLPVLLATVGNRLDWPHRRTDARASRFWTRWAAAVVRRRWAAAIAGLAVLGALLFAATSMHLGANAGNPTSLSARGDAATGLTALRSSGIGPSVLAPIEVLAPEHAAGVTQRRLAAVPGVQGAIAPADATWRRGGTAVVDVLAHDITTSNATLDRVRDVAHRVGADVRVGGIDAQNEGFISAVYGSFPLMITLIVIVTFVLLARAFRSLLLALKAVVLNVVSVGAAWGVLSLVWQKGYGSNTLWGIPATGSIPSWLPLIVFAFLYGLSMDYEVFILARVREEYDSSGSTDLAVVRAIGRTGRLITSAALILFLSFVAMSTAPGLVVKIMATGFGVGIILDATVVRSLLVPAAVSLLGRWNWYLPPVLARPLRVAPSRPVRQLAGGSHLRRADLTTLVPTARDER